MKISRQQFLPSIALLVALAGAVGYLAYTLTRRGPTGPPAAVQPSAEPAATVTSPAAAPPPMPSKDPFAAPTLSRTHVSSDAARNWEPDGGGNHSVSSSAKPRDSRPRLVGIVVGEKTVAAIRVGEKRYHVVAGDLIPGLGRVIQVQRGSVVIKGGSGMFRLKIQGQPRP